MNYLQMRLWSFLLYTFRFFYF